MKTVISILLVLLTGCSPQNNIQSSNQAYIWEIPLPLDTAYYALRKDYSGGFFLSIKRKSDNAVIDDWVDISYTQTVTDNNDSL